MVPLPCFFLNCWLLSSRRWSVGLRGDLDSVNSITWCSIRAHNLCTDILPLPLPAGGAPVSPLMMLWLVVFEGLESKMDSLARVTAITTSLLLIGAVSWDDIRSSEGDKM